MSLNPVAPPLEEPKIPRKPLTTKMGVPSRPRGQQILARHAADYYPITNLMFPIMQLRNGLGSLSPLLLRFFF